MKPGAAWAWPIALLVAWLLFALLDGLTPLAALAGIAAAAAGLLAGTVWPRAHDAAGRALDLAADLLGDGGDGDRRDAADGSAEGEPSALDTADAPEAMDAALASLADWLRADRVLVWRVDEAADRVAAEHAAERESEHRPDHRVEYRERAAPSLPRATPAAGSPLAWALRERSTLRLDPTPRWARGAVVVTPVDDVRVVSVEGPLDRPPEAHAVDRAAALLAPFLRLHDRQAHAVAAVQRLDRIIAFLRSVPREDDAARVPLATADAAMEVAGAAGAIVASWDEEEGAGEVWVRAGTGGGPAPGTRFVVMGGDLAHAARTGATVRRGPADGRWPDLAAADERWERGVAYRAVVPLVDPGGRSTGLLAVWGRNALADQGLALLEAIAPLLALQLRQAGELEHYRGRATADALTGLSNRAALDDRMAAEIARFHRYRRPLAVLVVDLDHFKRVNDTHGHDAGDAVLRHVAGILRDAVRDADFAARYGGEEMVVVLPETLLGPALDVAERVRSAIAAAEIVADGSRIPVTASIGVSACPECVDDPAGLFASADQALYAAKEGGRNRVTAAGLRQPA